MKSAKEMLQITRANELNDVSDKIYEQALNGISSFTYNVPKGANIDDIKRKLFNHGYTVGSAPDSNVLYINWDKNE